MHTQTKPAGFSYARWAEILGGLAHEDGLRSGAEIHNAIVARVVGHPCPADPNPLLVVAGAAAGQPIAIACVRGMDLEADDDE